MAWIFSRHGFFSIVAKGGEGNWQIRARARRHVVNLLEATGLENRIIESHHTDYAYRINVNAEQLHKVFDTLEKSLTYPNVKDAIAGIQGEEKYAAAMHRVWSIMADALQPGGAYSLGLRRSVDDSYRDSFGPEPEPQRDTLHAAQPPAPEVVRGKRGNGRKLKRDEKRPLDL